MSHLTTGPTLQAFCKFVELFKVQISALFADSCNIYFPLISHLRWQLLHQGEAFLLLQKKALRRLSSRFNGIGGAIGILSKRAPKPWNQAFSLLSLLPYLVLPKAFALKNLCFQGFEVHRILEITNFMIEWGKNAGNIWAYFRVFWRNYIENLYF